MDAMGRKGHRRRRSRAADQRGRRFSSRAGWFGLAAFVVLGLAVTLAIVPMLGGRTPAEATAGQEVAVGMAGFAPNRLEARAGEDLTLTFVNPDSRFHTDGGGWHQFRIEALGVDVKIRPSSRRTATLKNLPAGTYVFYCDVCCGGKENPAMRGILEVAG